MKFIAGFFVILMLFSCSKDEQIIDNSKTNWKLLVANESEPPSLTLLQMPEQIIIEQDVFSSKNNGEKLSGLVSKISEYKDALYIFIPSKYKIEIIDNVTFKRKATLDFSAKKQMPGDICFPNATDAYITHSNDSTVSLLDLTNYQIAREIKVGRNPVAIACVGNQIFVTNQADNTVSVIDSRTHQQEALIQVEKKPSYVDISNSGKEAIVVSLGNGKIDSTPKTAAFITFIDIATRSITKTIEIDASAVKAIDQFPQGLVVAQTDYAFVPTATNFLRIDTRVKKSFTTVSNTPYIKAFYNYKRQELNLLKKSDSGVSLETGDKTTGKTGSKFIMQTNLTAFYPLL